MSDSPRPSQPRNWPEIFVSAALSGVFIFLVTNYFHQDDKENSYNSAMETRMHNAEMAIAQGKMITDNLAKDELRTESSLISIENSQTTIQSTLTTLNDTMVNVKEQLNGHTSQLAAITDILRPVIPRAH